ncbi:hypothetical protein [Paenibacillus sp.]|jgi:hypothetical protein|uniref:hypothetical protein n=1 Tax=Paenibacillus sp. TaxID=58172 RepID=UPI002826CF73|nr:hypothetical protein [Paenibacillus sp.]MDR0269763.1 hypothetical protein [Paenibacillus sp.]
MTIEREIREHLRKEAETMECPPAISKRIEQSYSQYLQPKRSEKPMKKRLVGGIVAIALLIPTAAFAAPTLIDMLTRTPMTSEQVKVDEASKPALEKLYSAFPETKSFEIIDASYLGGDTTNSTNKEAIQTNFALQEKGGTGKKISLDISAAGKIDSVIQENWEPKEKPVSFLTDQEIKAKTDILINKMYGSIDHYQFSMEQMDNANQKTFILSYIKKGSQGPFYQAFIHGNTISVSLIQGVTTPSNIKVDGFFSTNGKPDYTADSFLNDDKLFSLLNMSPAELKQELGKGKSVVEVAASKNVAKQQVIDVIAKTQAEKQANGAVSKKQMEQLSKAVEPKVLHVIEHKTETPW